MSFHEVVSPIEEIIDDVIEAVRAEAGRAGVDRRRAGDPDSPAVLALFGTSTRVVPSRRWSSVSSARIFSIFAEVKAETRGFSRRTRGGRTA